MIELLYRPCVLQVGSDSGGGGDGEKTVLIPQVESDFCREESPFDTIEQDVVDNDTSNV